MLNAMFENPSKREEQMPIFNTICCNEQQSCRQQVIDEEEEMQSIATNNKPQYNVFYF